MKTIFLPLLLFISAAVLKAQPEPGFNKELLMSEKIAFFTKKIQFTPDEAKLFWPVYDEYAAKREALMLERRSIMQTCQNGIDQMDEAEIKAKSSRFIEIDQKELQLKESYLIEFKKILSPAKLLKFQLAEEHFRVHLLRQLKGHGKGRGPRPDNQETE